MAATRIWVHPTSGNDANDGLTKATAVATIAQANTLISTNLNRILTLCSGTHVLTADVTFTTLGLAIEPDPDYTTLPKLTGNFRLVFSSTNQVVRMDTIQFNNFFGTNGTNGYLTVGTNSVAALENCIIDGTGYTSSSVYQTGRNTSFKGCTIQNMGATNPTVNSSGSTFKDCIFKTPQSASARVVAGTSANTFLGCLFLNYAIVNAQISTTAGVASSYHYCTVDLKNGKSVGVNGNFIEYSGASVTLNDVAANISNCIFTNTNIVTNTNTGTFIITSPSVGRNCIETSTCGGLTGYAGNGDITTSSVQFYDQTNGDYRLEITSPASIENNGYGETIGAYELAKPSTFYDSLANNKVESGFAFKKGSRTNNGLGTLAAGETDGNKVLASSSLVTGLVPLSAVKATSGGTLPINKIAPSQGGSYLGEESNDVLDASKLLIGYNPTSRGVTVTATADIDALANLPSASVVLTGSGAFGKNLSYTPSFSPDYPAAANVTTDDTTNGVAGLIPKTKLMVSGGGSLPDSAVKQANGGTLPTNKIAPSQGGSYLGNESNTVITSGILKSGETATNLGNAIIGSYDPVTGNWQAFTSDQIVVGESALQDGVLIEGSADPDLLANLPSPSVVKTGSAPYGKNEDIIPAYSPDFPAPANVTTDDTTNGTPGLIPKSQVLDDAGGSLSSDDVRESAGGNIPNSDITEAFGGDYKEVSPIYVEEGIEFGNEQVGTQKNTNPGEDNVEAGRTWFFKSVLQTGTASIPTPDTYTPTEVLYGVCEKQIYNEDRLVGCSTIQKDDDRLIGTNDQLTLIGAD